MEGVIVRAKRLESTITVSVVSNKDGEYRFPKSRMPAGSYELSIRASGYALPAANPHAKLRQPKHAWRAANSQRSAPQSEGQSIY